MNHPPIEPQPAPAAVRPDLPRKIGFWGAMAVLVGVVIGSGIFRTPTTIAQNLGSPWLILAMWAVGGLVALCGALTFAELAGRFPHSGGVYVFLREAYGRGIAFVFGWTYMLVTKPAAAGGIAFIFAEHLNTLTGQSFNPAITTCIALFVLTLINVVGVRGSTQFAIAVTTLKYVAILGVIVLGVFAALRALSGDTSAHFQSLPPPRPFIDALIPVMSAIMWTYDGWADVGSIAGEVKEPRRTLPRVYIWGTLSVMFLYLLANAVYLWHIPLAEMAQTKTVAPLLLERLVGPIGSTLVTVLIIISTLGSSHASVMTGARVTFAQARDGLLFDFLARVDPRFQTPAIALWIQLALSCIAVIWLGGFTALADSFVFTMWIFYGLGAVALFIIRARESKRKSAISQLDEPLAYRVPLYPIVPGIFVLASAAMTVLAIRDDPQTTLIWGGVLLAGIPVYIGWSSWRNQS
ncbi:MAG: amino acid permease [Planctomycetota bacterium]|nr:amino acid permease [Planctomycetota bacterium]